MPIRAVLFDLGDTLWHFPNFPDDAAVVRELTERVAQGLAAFNLGEGLACERLAVAVRSAMWQATREAEHSHGRSPDFPALVRARAAEHDVALTEEQAETLWDAWHLGGAYLGRVLFPDSIATLVELRRRGYRLGCVTNRPHGGVRFLEELRESGLLDLFEALAVSCDDGWLKPNATLFRLALEELGVAADEALMVGDDLRADVMGAKLLGMVAVWKRPPGAELRPVTLPDGTSAEPDFVIDTPGGLLALPLLAGTAESGQEVRGEEPTVGPGAAAEDGR
jgi:HAD superfamily hydrolase (TIGR01549 family)